MGTDYPETIAVPVTGEHISQGERWDAQRCPVALAFADALRALGIPFDLAAVYGIAIVRRVTTLPGADYVGAGASYTNVAEYDASPARQWQQGYDREEPVSPATFTFTRVQR